MVFLQPAVKNKAAAIAIMMVPFCMLQVYPFPSTCLTPFDYRKPHAPFCRNFFQKSINK
jgi:hypothetical protein